MHQIEVKTSKLDDKRYQLEVKRHEIENESYQIQKGYVKWRRKDVI